MDDVLCFPLRLHTKLEGFIVRFPELAERTLEIICLGHPLGQRRQACSSIASLLYFLLFFHLLSKNQQEG